MKKKGLIISSIVMVVVLIASLTTATYAWFSNEGSATVTSINFAVGSSSDIVIGVAATNKYKSEATQADFYSDGITYTANSNSWDGDNNALGLSVDTQVDLSNMQKAVYSFTRSGEEPNYTYTQTAYIKGNTPTTGVTTGMDIAGATAQTPTAHIMKALGSVSDVTNGSIEAAVRQTDYLDVTLGSQAARSGVLAYGCMVYIKPTATKGILGLNAAIHVAYKLNTGSWVEVDVYGDNAYGTLKSSMTAPTLPTVTIDGDTKALTGSSITPAEGDAYVWIPLYTATDTTSFADYQTSAGIQQLELIVYVCGRDEDCLTTATGVGATISIEYLSINSTQWAA